MGSDWTLIERRVTKAALLAAPLMVVVAVIAMVLSPHEFAESDTATGWGLWLGAVLGLVMAVVVYAVPQLLFGLALRSGTRGKLAATAVAAALWAVLGLMPFVSAIVSGWGGVAPLAVVTVAAAGILDCFVFVVAFHGLRHGQSPSHPVVGSHRL